MLTFICSLFKFCSSFFLSCCHFRLWFRLYRFSFSWINFFCS
nr:MAG TPA: hypothetical protein [Crassvirales sp.]